MKPATKAAVSANVAGVVACAAIDAGLTAVLLTQESSLGTVLEAIAAHVAVSALAGLFAARTLPPFLKARSSDVIAFAGLVATFVPVLGGPGVVLGMRLGFAPPRRVSREPWVTLDLEKDVEEHTRHPYRGKKRTALSGSDIAMALRRRKSQNADYRFNAVLAIQRLPPKAGVPLLKLAQSDPVDEIRLYAFSRLERMRDDLEKQVKQITSSLATAEKEEQPRLHLRLAECYWELGYLGLAEGAVLEHALKSAHRHAAIACELLHEHASAEFFLGRILVHLRDPERALIAFQRAIAAGYPRIKLLPYLAECAYWQRDFRTVRSLLRELDASSPENAFFRSVMDFWQEAKSERPPPPPGSRKSISTIISRKSLAALKAKR